MLTSLTLAYQASRSMSEVEREAAVPAPFEAPAAGGPALPGSGPAAPGAPAPDAGGAPTPAPAAPAPGGPALPRSPAR
jgi:hypothetical protein